jgi:hypothetical protein
MPIGLKAPRRFADGVTYEGGYRGQDFAMGPQIRFDIPNGGFALKWRHELPVENRSEGDLCQTT